MTERRISSTSASRCSADGERSRTGPAARRSPPRSGAAPARARPRSGRARGRAAPARPRGCRSSPRASAGQRRAGSGEPSNASAPSSSSTTSSSAAHVALRAPRSTSDSSPRTLPGPSTPAGGAGRRAQRDLDGARGHDEERAAGAPASKTLRRRARGARSCARTAAEIVGAEALEEGAGAQQAEPFGRRPAPPRRAAHDGTRLASPRRPSPVTARTRAQRFRARRCSTLPRADGRACAAPRSRPRRARSR